MTAEVPALNQTQHLPNTSPERKRYNILIGHKCHEMTIRHCISNSEEQRKQQVFDDLTTYNRGHADVP